MKGEKRFYPIVRKWLEKEGYYCGGFIENSKGKPIYFQDKGTARLRIDVAGAKSIGSRVEDEIEVVAVEVRNISNVQYRDLEDAHAYSQYAHKCYLATTGEVDDQDKKDSHKLGIGLLEIGKNKVKEILSPQPKTPDYAKMMHFLNVLEVAKCPICGPFFETYVVKADKFKSYQRLTRPKYFKAVHDYPKVDVLDIHELKKLGEDYKTHRFICKPCIEELFSDKLKRED